MDMKAAKQALRDAVKARLAQMTPEARETQSKLVVQKLLSHAAFARCRSVAVYLSTATEVNTEAVVVEALRSGRACFVPRYARGSDMEMVQLRDMEDYRTLPRTPWGIPQPSVSEQRPQPGKGGVPALDLVVVPGVAFSMPGRRLGHGKGYYDRYLSALPDPKPTTIGLAFQEQMVQDLPVSELDVPVDHVLTYVV